MGVGAHGVRQIAPRSGEWERSRRDVAQTSGQFQPLNVEKSQNALGALAAIDLSIKMSKRASAPADVAAPLLGPSSHWVECRQWAEEQTLHAWEGHRFELERGMGCPPHLQTLLLCCLALSPIGLSAGSGQRSKRYMLGRGIDSGLRGAWVARGTCKRCCSAAWPFLPLAMRATSIATCHIAWARCTSGSAFTLASTCAKGRCFVLQV
jgi:hypothetical protein